jgi:thioredoxin reductase (NADPH)
MEEVQNVVIIGSGPAGLTAAIYASRAELKPLLIAGHNPGGQLMQTTEVENYPGFPEGIMGPELMNNMMAQAAHFGTTIMHEIVMEADLKNSPFTIKTEKAEYKAKTVIIAMGADANWLNLPNEQRLRGKGVSACATCDGFFFKDKEVIVVGGGDSAMEEATFLTKFASKVTIVHRRDQFRASKAMITRAKADPKIAFMFNSEVVDVLGADKVEGIRIKSTVTGETTDISAGGVFLAIGHTPNTKLLQGQIDLDEKGYVLVRNNTLTNIPGVFVAGDINDHRYRQAVTAAGMGAMAALDVEKYLSEKETQAIAEKTETV